MTKNLSHLLLFAFSMVYAATIYAEGGKIVKWVDNNGVTHYDDKAPMPSAASKSSELNKQGITVKKTVYSVGNPQVDELALAQHRRDTALIASYNSADEIDLARERNTKMDEFALQSLYQKLANQNSYFSKNSTLIAKFHKRKQPIPQQLLVKQQTYEADIASTDRQILEKKQAITAIRLRYNTDKARFVVLKAQGYTFTPQVVLPAKPATSASR